MLASTRIRRILFNTLFAGLIVLAGFLILRKHIDHDANGKLVVSSDVLAFVAAGDAMVHGSDLYYEASGAKTSYVYPPFYAFLNIPLTLISPLAVDIGWFILNVVMFGAVLRMSYYLFTGAGWAEQSYGRKVSLVLLVILCSLRYLIRNFQDANVNILVLFLIVYCFYQEKRGGGPWWAALVGIAGAIKILPLIIVVYYAGRGDWKRAGIVCGVSLGALLLPSVLMGFGGNMEALRSFQHYVATQTTGQGVEIENFSLFGFAGRIFSPNMAFLSDGGIPVFCNIASVPLSVIRIVVSLCNVILCGYLFWLSRTSRDINSVDYQPVMMIICLLTMNFVSILTEDHHLVSFGVVYLFFLVRWKLLGSLALKAVVIFSAAISTLLSYDIVVPLLGKFVYQQLLAFALPVLPVSIILFVVMVYTRHRIRSAGIPAKI